MKTIKTFCEKYILCFLKDKERPRVGMYLWVFVTVFMLFNCLMAFPGVPRSMKIILGNVQAVLVLCITFKYGYIGLVPSMLFLIIGIVFNVFFSTYPQIAKNKIELISQADDALYQSKKSGKNTLTEFS